MIRFYGYGKCSTCRQAKQHLMKAGVTFEDIDITQSPPPAYVLKAILKSGDYTLGRLFNRSGELYRSMNMKTKLPGLSEAEAIKLLAASGKLIKRPIVTDGKKHTVGYDAGVFEEVWG
ncbi:MAG: Spx/MgsR family RNA polymerase-binding regulatory protein [Phycisphaeraceae bacterium]